jgi:Ca-activated chloride channel family protein
MFKDWNIAIWEYDFLSPIFLLLILPLIFLLYLLFIRERKQKGEFKFSRSSNEQFNLGDKRIKYLKWFTTSLYGFVGLMFVLAFSKPAHFSGYDDFDQNYKNGIDIVIAMDISVSMLARDFEPNRLEASKKVAKEFIDGRKGDRIGLVVYEGEAYTACPSTLDYTILKKQIDALQPGEIEGGTAIGTGLGTAVTRLRNDSLPSKVIILLTDGMNNQGELSPEAAANLAKNKKIRVYTIGVGSMGTAPMPNFTPFGVQYIEMPVEIDEMTLNKIATITGGKYFRATNEESLRTIYKEIEKLEKRKIKNQEYKSEPPVRPLPFLNWALIGIIILVSIQIFYFRKNE